MSAKTQHGFHPDAESLSAFAEQSLSERERAEVFSHLAVCGRCRDVVALAREAAEAEGVGAPARLRTKSEPNAWWKQWRLVWVPTAVVTAFAAVSISFYIERTDRRAPEAGVVAQNPAQGTTPPSTPPPAEQAETVPPASQAPVPPPEQTAKSAHDTTREPLPAPAPPMATAQMPPEHYAIGHVDAGRVPSPPSHAEARQTLPGIGTGAPQPADSQPAAPAQEEKQEQAEEQRQAQVETDKSRVRGFATRRTQAESENRPAPPAASQPAMVMAPPPIVGGAGSPSVPAPQPTVDSALFAPKPSKQILLPGGLAASSSTSMGPLMLAVDNAGSLFLSRDNGGTWEHIKKQWKGRAVALTQPTEAYDGSAPSPTAQAETAPYAPGSAVATPPAAIFELFNDKGQVWVSTDGRTWTRK